MREAAQKLAAGQIDPNSTAGVEIIQEIAERVLQQTGPQISDQQRYL
ncbi:MAG TPA: hypothetical protein VI685_24975 [Candidatus Angelobacter sp.]